MLVMPSGIKSYFVSIPYSGGMAASRHDRQAWGMDADPSARKRRKIAAGGPRRSRSTRRKARIKGSADGGEILDTYLASESFKDKAPSTQAIDR
jgi:hypothetical protein